MPGYVPPKDAFPPCKSRIFKAIEKKGIYRVKWEMECRKSWKEREAELFSYLKYSDSWDLLMQYFFTLDAIQHAFPDNMEVIKEWYIMVDKMVERLSEEVPEDMLVLVVSDHGQLKGVHTTYGFYSSNIELGLKKPHLTDFRWLIEKMLKP